ncbi:MAG TPA: hypothetical protein VKS78_08115 [Roseiarcus sp.]|nr:hypothetical protein [Roseiarcus sp.]
MSFIVGVSFCCMIVGAAVGLEWADVSTVGLVLAALAATIFFSSIDAWECEGPQSESDEQPAGAVAKARN